MKEIFAKGETKILKMSLNLVLLSLLVIATAISVFASDKQLEKTLQSFGYKITGKISAAGADWELRDFKMLSKQIYNIKSTKAVPNEKNLFYRFTVRIEEFASVEDAQKRAAHIHSTPPGPDSKLVGPEYALREGFQRGTRVYVISTDVYRFVADESLKKLHQKLKTEITKNDKCRDSNTKCV